MSTSEKKNKSFQDIIDIYSDCIDQENYDLLPFCHTTTEGFASNIIVNKMEPQQCEVYNEELTYFFYGKATYLRDDETYNYTDDPPITFLYNSNVLTQYNIKRILPFDSGGFKRYGFKRGFLKSNYTYSTSPNIKNILAFIRLVYENHEKYLLDIVNLDELKTHQSNCLQIKKMIEMYESVNLGKLNCGPQVFSIEVQFDEEIDFEPSHIIVPYDFYTQPFWSINLKADHPNVKIEHYGEKELCASQGRALQGSIYQQLMRDKVMEIINGYLTSRQRKAS